MNALKDLLDSASDDLYSRFRPFEERMEQAGLHPMVLNVFKSLYDRLLTGDSGLMPESTLSPVQDGEIRQYDELAAYANEGRKRMGEVAIVKLNGGLGTSMGLERAKSLIPVRDGKNFLEIVRAQVEWLREDCGQDVPLVLMNSFRTNRDSLDVLKGFSNGKSGVPLGFLQNKFPKVMADSLEPAEWPDDFELAWNPPGHGDFYTALVTSKMLTRLLEAGIRYVFISNSDNLGAVFDASLLGYMVSEKLPFVMEVARRQDTDRKGGHLTRLQDGRLALREISQCPQQDQSAFQDIERHRYFNTNSIWLDLKALEQVVLTEGMIPLGLIRNMKHLDPRDPSSPQVIQLETALGAAISCFPDAAAVEVPRRRFSPVKTTEDLLTVMSDCYELQENYALVPRAERAESLPQVELDPKYYKRIDDFECRFPDGVPSLIGCTRLKVQGDVTFARSVAFSGMQVISSAGAASVYR